ncbi:MAG: protein O-mannosyl-transferase family [Gemmatimonas sp.]|uniref:protein O-mannosyl-transferase family n=1 Tax=Gemmatimonas sp. TaxID=1962908 RepID=UPI00391F4920
MVLLATYLATSAPDLTFWDASELATAAHTLGIPHPPGTPLWVLLAKVSAMLFSSTAPPRAVTLLSVWASALAGGVGAWMSARWIGSRGAVVAAVLAGAMLTVWNNATETEVYAVALLASLCMLAAGEWAGRAEVSADQRRRGRALLVFIAALAVPLHLSVLVALPAAVAFAWRGPRPSVRDGMAWGAVAALGLSAVVILPMLSLQNPRLDSGDPETWRSLLGVLRREQYSVAGLWPRQAPLWLQLGNVFQWADWQVAFGLHPLATAAWPRTALSVLWGWLGLIGLRTLWHHEARVGRAMAVLLLSGTLGVVCWLNLRAGPTFGVGVLPDGAVHEARERDYFFVLGFWAWGLLAGAGISSLAAALRRRWPAPVAVLPFALALVPLLANREVADRRREPVASLPRTYARLLLESVPPNGVLIAAGDNDTFPLWYLQQVEEVRPDVSIVTVPLLGARWYRAALAADGLLAADLVPSWLGLGRAVRSVMAEAEADGRAVRVSASLPRADRLQLDAGAGWALEGLVFSPSRELPAGSTGLDRAARRRNAGQVPPSAFTALPRASDPAAETAQTLLRCTRVTTLADPLLVSGCNGI